MGVIVVTLYGGFMVNGGGAHIDGHVRFQIVSLYWGLTTAISSSAELDPTDRLLVSAVETSRTDPIDPGPISARRLARRINRANSRGSITSRANKLVEAGTLARNRQGYAMANPDEYLALYAQFSDLIDLYAGPIIDQIKIWRPDIQSAALPVIAPAQDPDTPSIDGLILDHALQHAIARLFLDQSLLLEKRTGLSPLERLIILAIEWWRLSPEMPGGPSATDIVERTGQAESTIYENIAKLKETGHIVTDPDGLSAHPEITVKTYNAIIEVFISRVEPVIELIKVRRKATN